MVVVDILLAAEINNGHIKSMCKFCQGLRLESRDIMRPSKEMNVFRAGSLYGPIIFWHSLPASLEFREISALRMM